MQQTDACRVESHGPLLVVTLDRPERRNALDAAANHELGRIFDAFESDPAHRVAILTGAGDRAFCAGADLKADGGPADQTPASGFGGLTDRFDRTKPVIAAVGGAAIGGGFEIALACDLVIAAEHARFGLSEPRLGLVPGSGGIQRLVRELGPKRAHGLLLTARQVTAREGFELGFVNQVVPGPELMTTARRWADEILECSPAAIRATLAIADACQGQSLAAAMAGQAALPGVAGLIEGPDFAEGQAAFLEKRAPRWNPPSWGRS